MQMTGNTRLDQKESLFKDLIEQVMQGTRNPEDIYEVAAVMESMGWNDALVNETFGAEDIFDLAQDVWDAIQRQLLVMPVSHTESVSPLDYFIRVLRSFIRGAIFALPMAVSVLSMLTLRFSLWSYEYLSLENATSISIGTILSFMVVGGFTQAIARRGYMYLGIGYVNMARQSTYYFVKLGYLVCLITAGFYLLFNFAFSIYPWRMTLITILYLLFLSGIWLSVTILYILQKELTFTGLIVGGIALVFVLFRVLKINIIISQLISVAIVALASMAIAHVTFIRAERKMEKGISPTLPRLSITLYTSLPYFAYGFLYFTLIDIDRVIAWSTNNVYMPYFIWFRGEYELGLDFALLVLIFPMGLVEVVVNELMTNLVAHQRNFMALDAGIMNQMYVSFYKKRYVFVAIFSLLNAVLLYWGINALTTNHFITLKVFADQTTFFVFVWAVIAYSMLAVALMNSLILFCLSQPHMVSNAILIALIINVLVGFILSRWFFYYWAVIGLFVGCLVFTILTTQRVLQVLRNLDYYLYAAL